MFIARLRFYLPLCCALWLPLSLYAAGQPPFRQCVTALQQQALERGISAAVVEQVLGEVNHVARVIQLDRQQPEFNESFAAYLNRRVTADRVARGRELLRSHGPLLRRVAAQSGVPAQYLLAFWGLETNFGSYFGNMPVLDSLATLACDPRRSQYFTGELLAALQIVDSNEISVQQLRGSWAGAFGHMQFMPSVFLRHAVDGDGDGRRDLWGSLEDAMASAGSFLTALGWQRGLRWGREVRLPEGFPYQLSGIGKPQPLAAWRRLGITDADGGALEAADIEAALLVPAGRHGPAFLIYANFHTVMGWNRSEFYAMSVGHLADRIAGGGRLRRPPPEDIPQLPRQLVQVLQQRLAQKGLDAGPADGILGPATREAIRLFQYHRGMIADGYPSQPVLRALDLPVE